MTLHCSGFGFPLLYTLLQIVMTERSERILSLSALLGLIFLGAYVTLTFIGMDGHLTALMPQEVWRAIAEKAKSPFDRGLAGLFPFLRHLLSQLRPFLPYTIISALLYGGYVSYQVLKSGKVYLDVRLTALHILGLSLVSLWLIFVSLFYGSIPGTQQNVLIEPNVEVYSGIGPEGIDTLEQNFQTLLDAGCLTQNPGLKSKGDARVFNYSFFCMQASFVTRILPQVLMLLFLMFNFLILGKAALSALRLPPLSRLTEAIMCLGIGAALMIFLLWLLALFSQMKALPAWSLLVAIPLIGYRFGLYWLKTAYFHSWRQQSSLYALSLFLVWLLVSYLMFNFLTVIRPFPIGWDDLGRYINLPRQLSSVGSIIPGMVSMQWEYLTSLGFVLFGYGSTMGSVLAQQINWMAGLFAVLAVFLCTRLLLGARTGILAALFYYTLPMVGHFSFADMKTENALFAFGVLGFVALLLALPHLLELFDSQEATQEEGTKTHRNWWLIVAGVLFAAAFGTKPTIVLLFMMAGVILTSTMLGTLSAIGAMLLSFAVLTKFGGLDLSALVARATGFSSEAVPQLGFILFGISGLLFLLLPPFLRGGQQRLHVLHQYGITLFMLLLGFLAYSAPWMIRNMAANGRIAVAAALTAPNTVTPWIAYTEQEITVDAPPGSRALPKELQPNLENERCIGTSRDEELDRYWGFGKGLRHYLGVPWRVVMNTDSQGYYLTTSPFLLLFPLILLYPAFWKKRIVRLLFFGTLLHILQWVIMGNGIPWYGIGMFLGLAVMAEAFFVLAPNPPVRIAVSTLLLLSIATAFSFRLWQFDMQRNLYEFAWGKASAEVLREMTIPEYDDIAEHVERLSKNTERPFLYRAGTFISYFIPRNLTVITQNDNQLGFFNCLNQEEDHALTLKRLQALGFHSIVFDTNTATIEQDPNGTLHQKVKRFIDFANDNSIGITAVVNNPGLGIAYMILP